MAKDPNVDPEQDPTDPDPADPTDPDPEDPEDSDPDDKKDPKKEQDPEVAKAIRRRDSALARAKKAEDEAAALREKYEGSKDDPVAKANRKLVAAEARVVLTAAGFTESADQKVLMDFLGLDDVEVGPDGEVDSDTIKDRLEDLVSVVKKSIPDQRRGGGPRVDTRDRGGEKGKTLDPASKRRRDMLMGR